MNDLKNAICKKLQRIKDAEAYMNEPHIEGWAGDKLKAGIEERMQYVGVVQKLIKEANELVLKYNKCFKCSSGAGVLRR